MADGAARPRPDPLESLGAERLRTMLRRERAARIEAERLVAERDAALDRAFDGVALTDAQGAFVYMNDSHARMFGWGSGEDALGRSWRDLYAPDAVRFFETEVFPVIETSGGWRGEIAGRKPCGAPVYQEVTLSLLDAGLLCVTRDIGERRALELERRRLAERLRGAQALATLGRFAATLSHDFSAVIGAAQHYAESCKRACDGVIARHDLQGLETSLDRAQGLTKRLLQIVKPQPARRETVDLARLLKETCDLVFSGSETPAQISLAKAAAQSAAEVMADKVRLEQLLANLLFNAEQACRGKAGAGVQVSLRPVARGDRIADLADQLWPHEAPGAARRQAFGDLGGPGWIASVLDGGVGMDEGALGRLFEPFFSTKAEQGHGLGLMSIETSLEALGGGVQYRSAPGLGTLALAFIPTGAPAVAAAAAGARRVMVIEDDAAAAAAMAGRLGGRGMRTRRYDGAGAALRDFVVEEDWAAVVCDCGLGDAEGADVALAIARWRPDTPVFLVSSSAASLDTARLRAPFAAGFFTKPLSNEALNRLESLVLGPEAAQRRAPKP